MQPHYCWVEGRRIISSDLLAILWLIFEHPYNKSSRKLLRMTTSSLAWRQFNLIFNQHLNMLFSWCYFLSTLNFTFFFLCITPPPKKKLNLCYQLLHFYFFLLSSRLNNTDATKDIQYTFQRIRISVLCQKRVNYGNLGHTVTKTTVAC